MTMSGTEPHTSSGTFGNNAGLNVNYAAGVMAVLDLRLQWNLYLIRCSGRVLLCSIQAECSVLNV